MAVSLHDNDPTFVTRHRFTLKLCSIQIYPDVWELDLRRTKTMSGKILKRWIKLK